jgi:hypothetical protein
MEYKEEHIPWCENPDCPDIDEVTLMQHGHASDGAIVFAARLDGNPYFKRFASGAVRDPMMEQRFDLLSPHAISRTAFVAGEGANKYGENNWRLGLPNSNLINHAFRHLVLYISGDREEDHLAKVAWGVFAVMENELERPEMDDLYFSKKEE